VVFEQSPEAEAFTRWQRGEFLRVERQFAKVWRAALDSLDLNAVAAGMRAMGINPQACKSLEEAKQVADSFTNGSDRPLDRMKLALILLGIPLQFESYALERWRAHSYPALSKYAPFAAHVLTAEIFFQVALGADLIGTARASNRADMAYLFYLPLCSVFVSSDKLHRRCAPLLLRENQSFVWGQELKADLQRLNDYYNRLPETEKEKGIFSFAPRPPAENQGWLVSQLWDRHMRPEWRGMRERAATRDPSEDKKLIDHLKQFSEAPSVAPDRVDHRPEGPDVLTIEYRVHKRKGSWWQLPKNLQESNASKTG
jgi:hypothetical protein